jgi:hypothetical protein
MSLSTFLNGGTATQLRGLQWLALSDVGNIGAGTIVSDGGGGGTFNYTYGSAIPCRIDPLGSRLPGAMLGGRIDERSTHVITVPAGTDVLAASRFAVVGRGTFDVTSVPERTAEWTRVFEVMEIS